MQTTHLLAPALGAALALSALTWAPAHAVSSCDGRVATIEVQATSNGSAPVVGTPGDDVIVGTPYGDNIDGAGGHDVICGLDGPDRIVGGSGDDRIFAGLDGDYSIDDGYTSDLVTPGPGNDHVDLGADSQALHIHQVDFGYTDRVVYTDAAGPVTVDLTAGTASGEGTDTFVVEGPAGVVGSAFNDVITGSPYDDLIQAGTGDDTVDAREGNDHLFVDGGVDDTFTFAPLEGGNDVAAGGPGKDTLVSGGGTDRLSGDGGKDYLSTTTSTLGSLQGGPGKDRLYARGQVDVSAGAGKDKIGYELQPGFRAEIDGDGGRDTLELTLSRAFTKGERVHVNRPRQRITFTGSTTRLAYFEVEQLIAIGGHPHWTFVGTGDDDRFSVLGGRSLRAFGRGGNDIFGGTGGRDFIDGGPGRDVARSSTGRDICVHVERANGCEVRR